MAGDVVTSQCSVVWDAMEARLSQDPRDCLNTAVEACGRFASQSGRVALVVCEPDGSARRWTYAELDDLSRRCATMFASAGLRRGDRVATVLTRQVESLVVALATWRSGLVYVPLYSGFGSHALANRIEVSRATLVVTDSRFRSVVAEAQDLMATDVHIVTVGGQMAGDDRSFWDEIRAATNLAEEVTTSAHDLATLLFTSGTTGQPKACAMPHGALVALMPFAVHALGVHSESMLFTTADPGWSYGLYTTGVVPMALGVPRVMYTGPFDPSSWRRVMTDQRVTHIAAAPSAYRRLAPEFATHGTPPALVGATAAGEPLPEVVAQAWEQARAPSIHNGYGLSEVGMLLGDLSYPESGTRPGLIAGRIPGFDVMLVDAEGRVAGAGEPGRIAVKRPRYQLSTGYENAAEQWAARWVDDVFVTEDLATVEPDGWFRFVGRADDLIVTSGFNVSPVEVESALLQQAGVADVAVVAAADPVRGTVVRAVVVQNGEAPERSIHEDRLRRAVRHRLAHYAVPHVIDFVDELPRTEVGKLRRASLRQGPS